MTDEECDTVPGNKRDLGESRDLVVAAFTSARAKGRDDWDLMLLAVLNNQ